MQVKDSDQRFAHKNKLYLSIVEELHTEIARQKEILAEQFPNHNEVRK